MDHHLSGESAFLFGFGFTPGGTLSFSFASVLLVVSGSLTETGTSG
jgi:hypothetical protein